MHWEIEPLLALLVVSTVHGDDPTSEAPGHSTPDTARPDKLSHLVKAYRTWLGDRAHGDPSCGGRQDVIGPLLIPFVDFVSAVPKIKKALHSGAGRSWTPSHGNQLVRLFHVEPPDGFCDSGVDVGRLDGAEPLFGWRRTHDIDVPLRI